VTIPGAHGREAAPPISSTARRDSTSTSTWLQVGVLVALALLVAAMRAHTYAEPRDRDLGIYAWMGHYLFQGRPLYSDLVEIKPPLPYILYALVESATGMGDAQAYVLGVVSSWATMLGLFWLGARTLARPWLGLCAALFWVMFSSDLYLQANQPNTEVFINAFVVWAIVLLWSLRHDRLRAGSCMATGLLLACATLCKTVALVPACFLVLAIFLLADPGSRRRAFGQMCLVMATIALVWIAVLAWLAAQGSLAIALQILFVYPREYAALSGGGMFSNVVAGFGWSRLAPDFFAVQAGMVFLCVAALAIQLGSADRAIARIMLAWMIGIFVAVALPGNFYPHYYQLWLPWLAFALALVVDWTTLRLWKHGLATHGLKSAAVAAVVAAVWSVVWLLPQYRLSAVDWSVRKYGSQFVDAQALGRELRTRLGATQRLFVFGMFPSIYEESGREPFTGVLTLWLALPSMGGSLSDSLGKRVLGELKRTPPDMIVFDAETWALTAPGEPIRDWIATHYRLTDNRHNFAIAVLVSPTQSTTAQ
jgi:4-amino-4-deoxy-L-arabinose transferase-like glycosyltransferase